ncbi:hypothetical protein Y032_0323g2502 [Ancylostoma ceylanicum]|uniref:Uncharacterized protein n=1 Tax=Ancylostoma ceylanicum TaxID=53326 RepID=A0A016S0F0_9BILA|nr:hypothetical protein Y032_0323g2502 [Ancylostoma ceylanicum]
MQIILDLRYTQCQQLLSGDILENILLSILLSNDQTYRSIVDIQRTQPRDQLFRGPEQIQGRTAEKWATLTVAEVVTGRPVHDNPCINDLLWWELAHIRGVQGVQLLSSSYLLRFVSHGLSVSSIFIFIANKSFYSFISLPERSQCSIGAVSA